MRLTWAVLLLLFFTISFGITFSTYSYVKNEFYDINYKIFYNGFIAVPINKSLFSNNNNCSCSGPCFPIGIVAPGNESIHIIKTNKNITININIIINIFNINKEKATPVCIIKEARKKVLPYNLSTGPFYTIYYAFLDAGSYRVALATVSANSSSLPLFNSAETAREFVKLINDSVESAGLPVRARVVEDERGKYSYDFIFLNNSLKIMFYDSRGIVIDPPPGRDVKIGNVSVSSLETGLARLGGPGEPLTYSRKGFAFAAYNNWGVIVWVNHNILNIMTITFVGLARNAVYHWPSGLLLEANLSSMITLTEGQQIFFPWPELVQELYNNSYWVNFSGGVFLLPTNSMEKAALTMANRSEIESLILTGGLLTNHDITIKAVSLRENQPRGTLEVRPSEGIPGLLLIAGGIIGAIAVISLLYLRHARG